MKIARATEDDFEKTKAFLKACESLWERIGYGARPAEEDWEEWDEDDAARMRLMEIRGQMKRGDDDYYLSPAETENMLVIYKFLREKYREADAHWNRVIWNAVTCMDNCSDPTARTLEFYPGIVFSHVAPEQ